MRKLTLPTVTAGLVAVLLVWPLLGWFALYTQFETASGEKGDLTLLADHPELTWSSEQITLRLFPVPRLELTNSTLSLRQLPEPLTVDLATWRARWYSPWAFQWLPDRLVVHQGSGIQPAELDQLPETDWAWQLTPLLRTADLWLKDLPAVEIESLALTLFDAEQDRFVDLRLAGELRRAGDGAMILQSITDLSGDGWVDHGFLRAHGRWRPESDSAQPLRIDNADLHLEFASTTQPFGNYQWSLEADTLTLTEQQQSAEADFLSWGVGQSAGTDNARHQETGHRTAINHWRWSADDPLWRAESIQHASALAPHDPTVDDIRWFMEADQWRLGGDEQVGRTQITWELNLNDDTLNRVRAQMIQAGGNAPTLGQWHGDYAELTLTVNSRLHDHQLSGFASVNSDMTNGILRIDDAELTEQREQDDTLWLYLDAIASADGLSVSELSGSLDGNPRARSDSVAEWVDCYDTWSPLFSAILMDCATQ